jgi:hypothetical protein
MDVTGIILSGNRLRFLNKGRGLRFSLFLLNYFVASRVLLVPVAIDILFHLTSCDNSRTGIILESQQLPAATDIPFPISNSPSSTIQSINSS